MQAAVRPSRETIGERSRTHGLRKHPIYGVWHNMMRRCHEPMNARFVDYGGRGITVCHRWRKSVKNFFDDMGECPPGLSLERRDNDKGYSKSNCYWGTSSEQARNRRSNRTLTVDGETHCLAVWSERTGASIGTLWARMNRGWADDVVVKTPVRPLRKPTKEAS